MYNFDDVTEKWRLTSLVVGILKDGVITTSTTGVRSQETAEAATIDTRYGIGSISKVFTATLAMVMVERGLVALDVPIASYYPDFPLSSPLARETMTLRHLLTHRSGIEGDGFVDTGNDRNALARFVAGFAQFDQVSAPGDVWSYSNNGLCLAGAVLAHAAGMSYEDALRTCVLEPLGLSRSGFGQSVTMPNTATGYDFGPDGATIPKDPGGITRSANPAGGVMSTVPDLLRFAQFHLGLSPNGGEPFLATPLREEMQRTQASVSRVEAWGIGWGKKLEGNTTWVLEHGGWMNGYRAQLTLIPEQDGAFAILTNSPLGHAAIEDLQVRILAESFGIQRIEEPVMAADRQTLDRYTGRFRQSHMDAEILCEGNDRLVLHLKTRWHGNGNEPLRCPLALVAPDEFVITDGEFTGSRIEFLDARPEGWGMIRILHRVCFPVSENTT